MNGGLEISDNRREINFIPVSSSINWDEYFMLQAVLASFRSKDPSTKVGCVFVDANHHQISMGYNGAIAGIDESQIPWGNDRSVSLEYQKYGYVIHSEANAISHATRSLAGSCVYVTLFPCNECAKLIASQKIAQVVYLSDKYLGTPENNIAKKIFTLSGITFRQMTLSVSTVDKLHCYMLQTIQDCQT